MYFFTFSFQLTTAKTILNRAHRSLVLRDMAKRSCNAPSWRAIYSRAWEKNKQNVLFCCLNHSHSMWICHKHTPVWPDAIYVSYSMVALSPIAIPLCAIEYSRKFALLLTWAGSHYRQVISPYLTPNEKWKKKRTRNKKCKQGAQSKHDFHIFISWFPCGIYTISHKTNYVSFYKCSSRTVNVVSAINRKWKLTRPNSLCTHWNVFGRFLQRQLNYRHHRLRDPLDLMHAVDWCNLFYALWC